MLPTLFPRGLPPKAKSLHPARRPPAGARAQVRGGVRPRRGGADGGAGAAWPRVSGQDHVDHGLADAGAGDTEEVLFASSEHSASAMMLRELQPTRRRGKSSEESGTGVRQCVVAELRRAAVHKRSSCRLELDSHVYHARDSSKHPVVPSTETSVTRSHAHPVGRDLARECLLGLLACEFATC